MTEQISGKLKNDTNINPYVSKLADRLMRTAANAEMKFDSTGWQLITEVLSYAAAAEQRMSEQESRIGYLEQLSVTDELTGIANRRGLQNALSSILASAARHRETGVLGFLDLDGFKNTNDTYGHLAGDSVLRHVAKCLKKFTRPDDVIARISGDEFAIVLKRCTPEQGRSRLRALQRKINNSHIRYDNVTIPVQCSIGQQHFDGTASVHSLIESADLDMYSDKQARKTTLAESA
ncbi:GGDEF domain-containing protein [Kordiimonas pumila]|uniref:diguanylate cyclase n=1 Tax=Kordiimonas pumila TaxID=2161677 RepID=A0ABV7D1L6_9PROT|nr:GGDEF domain-containing protein [Kordiimonas pumila]